MKRSAFILTLLFTLACTNVRAQEVVQGLFDCGGQVRIEATPLPGYRFVKWSDGDTSSVRMIDVDGDIELRAIFDDWCYDVSVPVMIINDFMATVNRRQLIDEGLITETMPEDSVRWYREGVERPVGSGFVLQLSPLQEIKDYYVEVALNPEVAKSKFICSRIIRGYPIPLADLPYTSTPLLPYTQKVFKDGMIYIKRNESLYTIDGQRIDNKH